MAYYVSSNPTIFIGVALPADAAGYLKNNGSGTLSWATPNAAEVACLADPGDAVGYLNNDGAGNLAWNSTTDVTLPTATVGFLKNDGSDNLEWIPDPGYMFD